MERKEKGSVSLELRSACFKITCRTALPATGSSEGFRGKLQSRPPSRQPGKEDSPLSTPHPHLALLRTITTPEVCTEYHLLSQDMAHLGPWP